MAARSPIEEFYFRLGEELEKKAIQEVGSREKVLDRMRRMAQVFYPQDAEEIEKETREGLLIGMANLAGQFPQIATFLITPDDKLDSPEIQREIEEFAKAFNQL